jgi:hypothetical protein
MAAAGVKTQRFLKELMQAWVMAHLAENPLLHGMLAVIVAATVFTQCNTLL